MYSGELRTCKVEASTMAYPEPQRPMLLGNVLEVQFEYEGHPFWIAADYYMESEGTYLISYKVGMTGSWFATACEYGTFFEDIHIKCSKEEIVDVLQKALEEKKIYAAKRYLESVYQLMFRYNDPAYRRFQLPMAHALASITSMSTTDGVYIPFDDIRKSVLIRTVGNLYYYGHFSDDGTNLQLFGTETDAAYIKVGDITVPDQKKDAVEKLLYNYVETYKMLIHSSIQTTQMPIIAAEETLDPNWEQAITPYRGKEIQLWPEF